MIRGTRAADNSSRGYARFMELLEAWFSSDFVPHGLCSLWNPRIVWLHVVAEAEADNGLISISPSELKQAESEAE
jgi:hypothetical protein